MNTPDLAYIGKLINVRLTAEGFCNTYEARLDKLNDYKLMLEKHEKYLEAGEISLLHEWVTNLNKFIEDNLDMYNTCNQSRSMSPEQFKEMEEGYELCLTQLKQ